MDMKENLRLRLEEIRNDRIRIYGGYAIAVLLVLGAVMLGMYGQSELASALLVSSAVPASIAASTRPKK